MLQSQAPQDGACRLSLCENCEKASTSNGFSRLGSASAGVEGAKALGTPPKTSEKAAQENKAKAGNISPKKRQSHIDEMLHKTRHGAIAKNGKGAQRTTSIAGEHLLRFHMQHRCAVPRCSAPHSQCDSQRQAAEVPARLLALLADQHNP